MEKKNKKSLIFLVLLFVIGITVGGTIAFFSSRDTFSNEFNSGTYVIQTQERFESPDDWTPGTTTDKEVIVTNKGTTLAAVRVKLTESWKDADNNPLALIDGDNNPAAIINYGFDKDYKWEKVGDWYYYFRPVDQNESTSSLLESVTFNPNVSLGTDKDCTTDETTHATTCTTETNDYGGGTYTLVIDIETCQYDKYQEIWNTNVEISPPNTVLNGTLKVVDESNAYKNLYGKTLDRDNFESVNILDIVNIPAEAIDSWDASVEQNGSIMAWYTDLDENGKYELYIGQEGGVKANPNSKSAFSWFQYAKRFNMKYLDTSNVTTMESMFDWGGNFLTKNDTITITGLENWNTSNVENMYRTFAYMGRNAKKWRIGDISNWDTSKVTTMEEMFLYSAYSSDIFDIGNIGKWDVSNVESMKTMFHQVLYYGSRFYIGDLTNWDTRKVTNMSYMFAYTAYNAEDFNIGTLNVYADNITSMFSSSKEANAIINIRSNPTSYSSAFSRYTSTYNSQIVVNYSSITTNIDAIVGTNFYNNVIKGSQLD